MESLPAADSIEATPTPTTLTLTKAESRLANKSFHEVIDASLLERLLGTKLIDGKAQAPDDAWFRSKYNCSEREHLVKLRNKLKDGVFQVKYRMGKIGYGRVYPERYLAAIALRRPHMARPNERL